MEAPHTSSIYRAIGQSSSQWTAIGQFIPNADYMHRTPYFSKEGRGLACVQNGIQRKCESCQ